MRKGVGIRRQIIAILGVVQVLGALTACATPRFETFPEALYSCRMMQPNRVLRKASLPATDPRIATCLERHGWSTDGRRP